MGKLIAVVVSILGCFWLLNRFPVLGAPAFHLPGTTLGVAWGFLLLAIVMVCVLRLKSSK